MINGMARAMKGSVAAMSTWASMKTERSRARAFIPGPMAKSMMATGLMVRNMGTESGLTRVATLTLASGLKTWRMAMECTSGLTGIGTRASGSTLLDMARGQTFSTTEMFIWESTSMEQLRDLANIAGQMATRILVSLRQARSKAKVFGKRLLMQRRTPTSTRESTSTI